MPDKDKIAALEVELLNVRMENNDLIEACKEAIECLIDYEPFDYSTDGHSVRDVIVKLRAALKQK